MIGVVDGRTPGPLDVLRDLILEYAASLPVDVSHERMRQEAEGLPGEYAPPRGALLLAMADGSPLGCAALRPLDRETCELKRVYVRPEARGRGIGRTMVITLIGSARRIGYRRMRLDTVPALKPALGLYRSLGFRFIAPYRAIPTERALFMELMLGPCPPPRPSG
jgi:ribosomal protein S18 acetylase RimI-like enzyme